MKPWLVTIAVLCTQISLIQPSLTKRDAARPESGSQKWARKLFYNDLLPSSSRHRPAGQWNWGSPRSPNSVRERIEQQTLTERIFQGFDLQPHEFPWMVKVKASFPPDGRGLSRQRSCGGALIAPNWVVTARHCVTWHPLNVAGHRVRKNVNADEVVVFIGSHSEFGEDGLAVRSDGFFGRQDYGATQCNSRNQAETCPAWMFWKKRDSIFTNDIALLRLSRPAPLYSSKVGTIRLPWSNPDYVRHTAYVSGWGIGGRRAGNAEVLRAAEMQIVPSSKSQGCRDQQSMGKLCAGTTEGPRGGAACPGDSGSPLVVWDAANGGWTLAGLLSNGARDCFDGRPAVYTRVGDYVGWMLYIMENYSPPRNVLSIDRLPRRL